jgi:NADH:ubiquinone oxidoreductase subunit D
VTAGRALIQAWLASARWRHMLADVSAIIGSLDIVFGEIDR